MYRIYKLIKFIFENKHNRLAYELQDNIFQWVDFLDFLFVYKFIWE